MSSARGLDKKGFLASSPDTPVSPPRPKAELGPRAELDQEESRMHQDGSWVVVGLSGALTLIGQPVSRVVCQACWPVKYAKLGKKQKECDTRIISSVHAVIVTALSFYVLLTESPSICVKTDYESPTARLTLAITTGYLIGDALSTLWSLTPYACGPISSPVSTLAHHILGAVNFGTGLHLHRAYILGIMFIATEASTPLVNLRWHLHEAGFSHTAMYKVIGILMVIVFVLTRLVPLPFHFFMVAKHVEPLVEASDMMVGTQVGVGLLAVSCLNCYWAYLMLKGLVKLLKRSEHVKETD